MSWRSEETDRERDGKELNESHGGGDGTERL